MPSACLCLAGDAQRAGELESALKNDAVEADFQDAQDLAVGLRELERRLSENRPAGAVAVGTDDGGLALAITATKLGVPFAACLRPADSALSGGEGARRRIISTLASLDAGSDPKEAAPRLVEWLSGAARPEPKLKL